MFPPPETDWRHSDLFSFDQNTVKILKHPKENIKIDLHKEIAEPGRVPYQSEQHIS